MRRFRDGGRDELSPRAEINVTSLVDVAFTLLIIFMITAPILQGGVEIAVPRAPTAPLQTEEGLVVSVDGDGQIYMDETAVTLEEFRATVARVVEERGSPTVYVKGDSLVDYGLVLRVIGTLKAAEVDAVSLVALPEPEGGER